MYACICSSHTDAKVEEAIDNGANTYYKVHKNLGTKPKCGKCKEYIELMIKEGKASRVDAGAC